MGDGGGAEGNSGGQSLVARVAAPAADFASIGTAVAIADTKVVAKAAAHTTFGLLAGLADFIGTAVAKDETSFAAKAVAHKAFALIAELADSGVRITRDTHTRI